MDRQQSSILSKEERESIRKTFAAKFRRKYGRKPSSTDLTEFIAKNLRGEGVYPQKRKVYKKHKFHPKKSY